jgi:NAD(P)-dependent dehydrogenase (short-subunit alcohol dehydrogenase family)
MSTAPLAGKVAFVTGIARGQGRSHAVRLGVAQLGRLDIVVASAGISPPAVPMWHMPPETFDDVITTNLTGVFNTLALSVPHIRAGKR